MDVVPPEEGWETDPFNLVEKDGKLYGRGAVDNKGPMMCWINAIEAYQATKTELPVNIKFIIEGMHEVGSEGLGRLMLTKKKTFLKDIDFVCINDTSWAGMKKPSVSYGTRGLLYFSVSVEGLSKDLHSGEYGGAVVEPLADLIFLMNSLQDHNGRIQVPRIHDDVLQVTPEEERVYKSVTLDVEEMRREVGANKLAHKEDKVRLLMHRWRFPSISYHGIEGAYSGPGGKSIIPAKVVGKFSVRLVQHMQTERATMKITEHLEKAFKLRKSPNRLDIQVLTSTSPWSENPMTPHYTAARKAIKHAYQIEPDLVREGSTLPICNLMHEMTEGKSILLLPLATRADGVHASNEKMDLKRYILGVKVIAGYIYELSLV
ncbi:hypothetical protein L9F63_018319 [Diploptera punctata]|uniref:Peptidase M20 dimerisation domain-containing protein n=1 Tax=Diploptera punctata TaxID=6984 RepID=A0AAD7ZX51_DIPPU|nr:hypothetical protein L9F63_018319 [Diploptera punctata]